MDYNQINGLTLAYVGDSVYETYVRSYLINKGLYNVNNLNKLAKNFTSSISQKEIVYYLIDNNYLNDEELQIYKRGRNSRVKSIRHNVDINTYLSATGFEAVIGYLYLNSNIKRLEEIIKIILEYKEVMV